LRPPLRPGPRRGSGPAVQGALSSGERRTSAVHRKRAGAGSLVPRWSARSGPAAVPGLRAELRELRAGLSSQFAERRVPRPLIDQSVRDRAAGLRGGGPGALSASVPLRVTGDQRKGRLPVQRPPVQRTVPVRVPAGHGLSYVQQSRLPEWLGVREIGVGNICVVSPAQCTAALAGARLLRRQQPVWVLHG
jgi:hypothetical protein